TAAVSTSTAERASAVRSRWPVSGSACAPLVGSGACPSWANTIAAPTVRRAASATHRPRANARVRPTGFMVVLLRADTVPAVVTSAEPRPPGSGSGWRARTPEARDGARPPALRPRSDGYRARSAATAASAFSGSAWALATHPRQHTYTVWPFRVTGMGLPIDPSSSPVTGHVFCPPYGRAAGVAAAAGPG